MSKTIVFVTDRQTLQDTIYSDVEEVETIKNGGHDVVVIIRMKSGAIHHFPTNRFKCKTYKEKTNGN